MRSIVYEGSKILYIDNKQNLFIGKMIFAGNEKENLPFKTNLKEVENFFKVETVKTIKEILKRETTETTKNKKLKTKGAKNVKN